MTQNFLFYIHLSLYIYISSEEISRYFIQQVEATISQMAKLRPRAVQCFIPGLFHRFLVHVAMEHHLGTTAFCVCRQVKRGLHHQHILEGAGAHSAHAPRQLSSCHLWNQSFFLIFLLLKAACAKFGGIHMWKWSTWVSVYWGCRFSLHLGMLTGTRDYSAPKPFQVFLGEWLSTVDNRDFLLTKL